MREISILICSLLFTSMMSGQSKVNQNLNEGYRDLSKHLNVNGIKKNDIFTANYHLIRKDTFVKVPKGFFQKYGVPFEERDSLFLEIYKDIVYKKYSMDAITCISMGIEAANHSPIEKPFNLGILEV